MTSSPAATPAADLVSSTTSELEGQLIDLRRELHAHPELAWAEHRTTDRVAEILSEAGLVVQRLPKSGLIADLGHDPLRRKRAVVMLRADLDALPVADLIEDPWRSTNPGIAHACGHDVHVASLVGAGLALRRVEEAGLLPGRVRLLFQPAEEVMPGGAREVLATGALDDVSTVFGLHCDPSLDVGKVGLRVGPITGAADSVRVLLTGRGGHTSRPHLTQDLTYALGALVTQLPAVLGRRLDPRVGASLVWGLIRAGSATNVIPGAGEASGTVRMLDPVAWSDAEELICELIAQIVAPYGVDADITYTRGVPPVVNEPAATARLLDAVELVLGEDGVESTMQSLGGEDFGWYTESVAGAMGRLGTRTPGGPTYDLHQGDLRVDEACTAIGARVLAQAALQTLEE